MRKPRSLLEVLFPDTRRLLLGTLLVDPPRWWYLSSLAKHLRRPPSSLQRELETLTSVSVLRRKRDGNRVYYQANRSCPAFDPLRQLILACPSENSRNARPAVSALGESTTGEAQQRSGQP